MTSRPRRNRLFICCLLAVAACVAAQDSVESSTIPVPAYLGSIYLGEIAIQFTSDDTPLLRPGSLMELLRDQLTDDVLDQAGVLYPAPAWARLEEFSQLGIVVELDWDTLSVVVEVPPHLTRPQTIRLAGPRREPRGDFVPQAPFSLIANIDLWMRYRYEDRGFDLSFTPDLALNFGPAVVEAKGGVRTGAQPLFLDYARLVWDFPRIAYRLEVGDSTYLETKLSDTGSITGVSFVRSPSISGPEQARGPIAQELSLADGSDVSIMLNDSRLQDRFLSSGNYLITDFPVVQGINTILIAWESEEGPQEIELIVPADTELLTAGELDAGLAVGIADRDLTRPVVASYQRLGLTDYVTFGFREGIEPLDLQIDLGLFALLATNSGTIVISPDLLIGPTGRVAVDVPLSFRYLDSRRASYRSFGVTTGMTAGRADATAEVDVGLYGSGFFNLAFDDGFSITPRGYYSYSTLRAEHFVQLRAGLRKSIRGGSSITADLGFVYDQGPSFVATVSYAASFPERQQNLFLQQDLDAQKFNAYWSRYAGDSPRDIDVSASAQVPVSFDEAMNFSAQLGYVNPFLRASGSHGFTGIINQSQFTNATTARVQSAVVMAGGQFAVTTPVTDSFVIIAAGESAADTPLRVNRTAAGSDFDLLGSAGVMPNLSSYVATEVSVETQDLVLGTDDHELRYHVLPGYRSGTLIRVELERNIYVGGVLADSDGSVLGYRLGSWEKVESAPATGDQESADPAAPTASGTDPDPGGDPARLSGEFFTDEDGYFEIYNVSPGEYRLWTEGPPGFEFSIVIPPEADEFHDLEIVQARSRT